MCENGKISVDGSMLTIFSKYLGEQLIGDLQMIFCVNSSIPLTADILDKGTVELRRFSDLSKLFSATKITLREFKLLAQEMGFKKTKNPYVYEKLSEVTPEEEEIAQRLALPLEKTIFEIVNLSEEELLEKFQDKLLYVSTLRTISQIEEHEYNAEIADDIKLLLKARLKRIRKEI
ncbi:hypothetical protein GW950_00875 [Candidatus Wolfebacteria bacterium]|nr:hypothetical protein [Candidatus Wolfebacteria bacterium]